MKKILKFGAIVAGVGAAGAAVYHLIKKHKDFDELLCDLFEAWEDDADEEYEDIFEEDCDCKHEENEKHECTCGGNCNCDHEDGHVCTCHSHEEVKDGTANDKMMVEPENIIPEDIEEIVKELEEEIENTRKKNVGTRETIKSKKNGRAVIQLDEDMGYVKQYDTMTQASRETGVSAKAIRNAIASGNDAGGYFWKDVE